MNLNYTVDYNEIARGNFSDDAIASTVLRNFQEVYEAALYIFKNIFYIEFLEVTFENQDIFGF